MCLTDFSHVEHVERVEGVFSLEFRVWSAGVLCKICIHHSRRIEYEGEEVREEVDMSRRQNANSSIGADPMDYRMGENNT